MLQSDLHHSNFFLRLPPAIFFDFLASSWLDVQSPMLDAGHLAGMCAVPPTVAEVHSDVYGAYHAHARAEFLAYECIPKPDAINFLC